MKISVTPLSGKNQSGRKCAGGVVLFSNILPFCQTALLQLYQILIYFPSAWQHRSGWQVGTGRGGTSENHSEGAKLKKHRGSTSADCTIWALKTEENNHG